MSRPRKPRPRVTPAQVAEAIGYVMRKKIRHLTDEQLGRLVLLWTTGRV